MEKRVALCIRGAVSRKRRPVKYIDDTSLPLEEYIDINVIYNSIKKHIIDCNKNYKIDIFIHCWDMNLEEDLVTLYKPVKYLFENNNKYKSEMKSKLHPNAHPREYNQASQLLTIQKVIMLKEEYEKVNNFYYDKVILYRPDLLLWKDMILDTYDNKKVYVNQWSGNSLADFHFVMSNFNSKKFKCMYDILDNTIEHILHSYIKYYVENYMGLQLVEDNIKAGHDQEVLRIIKLSLDYNKSITIEKLKEYGFKSETLKDYMDYPFEYTKEEWTTALS
jgi:hypothetical protein